MPSDGFGSDARRHSRKTSKHSSLLSSHIPQEEDGRRFQKRERWKEIQQKKDGRRFEDTRTRITSVSTSWRKQLELVFHDRFIYRSEEKIRKEKAQNE